MQSSSRLGFASVLILRSRRRRRLEGWPNAPGHGSRRRAFAAPHHEGRKGDLMTIRPRRSVLYMPGSNARALEKAKTLAVDGVILDLEDAVAPDARVTAREQAIAAVKAGGCGPRDVFIRINVIDTPWFADDLN